MLVSQSWAAKYRPHFIKDIFGQERVKAEINGLIKHGFCNTLLVTGPTSSGKTTLARAIANTINHTPRNQICPDYLDRNVAADGGIDSIRELAGIAKYMPRANLRIICLDEAHALTPNAREALLKLLEEPPKHTSWILCTTEAHKLTNTMRGRAITINMQYPDSDTVLQILQYICEKEQRLLPTKKYQKLLQQIIINTQGQPRESIQLLQKVAAVSDDKAAIEQVLHQIENDSNAVAIKLLACLYCKNLKVVIRTLREVNDCRSSLNTLLYLNEGLLNQLLSIGYSSSIQKRCKELLDKQTTPDLSNIVRIQQELIRIKNQMYYGTDEPRYFFAEITKLITK